MWLSTRIFVKALKSSGISITGRFTWFNSDICNKNEKLLNYVNVTVYILAENELKIQSKQKWTDAVPKWDTLSITKQCSSAAHRL